MLKARVLPCLLLQDERLVKTIRFDKPSYVGDPVNAVKIYNEKEVDELVFLDIRATVDGREPPYSVIADIADECFMPFAYGGGVRTFEQAKRILEIGCEKVIVNTALYEAPDTVRRIIDAYGAQSVVASLDARRGLFGGYEARSASGRRKTGMSIEAAARHAEAIGVGEILVHSIDRDGTMTGFDLPLVSKVAAIVSTPLIACGGAGEQADIARAIHEGGASAVACGSLFVYQGRNRAVLINYPSPAELADLLENRVAGA